MIYDILKYFANSHRGSVLLQVVEVCWDTLDAIERQMVASLYRKDFKTLSIYSKSLNRAQLIEAVESTPSIAL